MSGRQDSRPLAAGAFERAHGQARLSAVSVCWVNPDGVVPTVTHHDLYLTRSQ